MNAKSHEQLESSRPHRLHALCPYFAMFPPDFVRGQVHTYTKKGDVVLDPFCGRGTAPFEALVNGRIGIGGDISPVAACISSAKLSAPSLGRVLGRIAELENGWKAWKGKGRIGPGKDAYPRFFDKAYSRTTLTQLLFLRSTLRWKPLKLDRFIASLVLAYLHGESRQSEHYLSNHMPHSIALYPQYLVRYWSRKRWSAPETNVFDVLRNRAEFRLADDKPELNGVALHADARTLGRRLGRYEGKVSLVITSPPYFDLVNFAKSQWLRLWFLGGKATPVYHPFGVDDRHIQSQKYFDFLAECWRGISALVSKGAALVCRIGARRVSSDALHEGLLHSVKQVWPHATLLNAPSASDFPSRQTDTFCPGTTGCREEWDFTFQLQ